MRARRKARLAARYRRRPVAQWKQQTFAALAIRDFRILWLGTFTSFLAFFMSTVVNSVVAFGLAGTNRAVGLVIFAQGVTMFVLGPIGGATADRLPKRRVVATGQAITAAVFLATAWLVASGRIEVWHLAAGGSVLGACFAFLGPARQALVVEIVPEGQRGNAMALSQVANNASRVGGPAAAGGLLAWAAAGPAAAYAVMAVLYAAAAVSLTLLPRSRRRADIQTHVFADVLDGLRYVHARPHLRLLVGLFVAVVMTGFPYIVVMPGLVENQLGRGAEAIGLLMGVSAAGGLLASLGVARFADSPRARGIYCAMGLAFAASLAALALAPGYAAAAAVSFGLGVASGGFQTLASAVLIHATDAAYMGRVMSLTLMAFAGFGLVGLPVGLLADAVGERGALLGMAGVVALVVLWCGARLARLEAAPVSSA